MALTSFLVQLVEDVQQLWVHVVDGLEEREHGAVIGDTASTHMVAFHAVQEGGHRVLQRFQKLLVVLLGLTVLILLLKAETRSRASFFVFLSYYNIFFHLSISTYLHYADWLSRHVSLYRLTDGGERFRQWHRRRGWRSRTFTSFFLFFLPVCSVQVTSQLQLCWHRHYQLPFIFSIYWGT